MSRHRKDPLRPLTADERQELTRLSRSLSAPAAQVERSRALLAIADGASYTVAARQVGRRHNETISAWVSRFNRDGLAAVRPGHGGGPRIRYGADAQQRILAEWARTPQREQDGTATWSLSLLQKALRHAPDGLPRVSTFTIWRTLHAGGLSWQKSRTWCETGVVMRKRKHGVVRVSDPDAMAKKTRSAKLTGTLAVPRRPGRHPGCGGSGGAQGPGMPPAVETLAKCGPSLPADLTQLAHSGWAQPRRRGRDQAHLPTEHGGRGGRLAPTGPALVVALRAKQMLEVVVGPRQAGHRVTMEQPGFVAAGHLAEVPDGVGERPRRAAVPVHGGDEPVEAALDKAGVFLAPVVQDVRGPVHPAVGARDVRP